MTKSIKQMWLAESIFDWEAEGTGGRISDMDRVRRPYELLLHAHNLLETSSSALARADAVANLKRSINSRLQHLEELYRFSERFPKRIGALQRLEAVGLARPFLINKIFELRNAIEHKDEAPPDIVRCSEFADVTWYFLKATDHASKLAPDSFELNAAGAIDRYPPLGVTVSWTLGKPNEVEIAGWLSLSELSEVSLPGFLPIDIHTFKTNKAFERKARDEISNIAYSENSKRGADERWVIGRVATSLHLHQKIWRLALDSI
jgi:hypothetical protein